MKESTFEVRRVVSKAYSNRFKRIPFQFCTK